ncbi:hypothetical protein [Gemmobacter serpentinus]|uniref:hypothetical protein n=1 Tax=Gemmobacter serpentinus TaxID=2652247 RepID=UPI00124D9CDF|nr:hypothetical protein [Gemmobacter serpentinus]
MGAGNRLPVRPGEEYFLAADFRASGTTPSFRTRIVVWMYDRAGTYLGAAVGGIAILTNTVYTQQSLTWTVPAGVAYCEVGFGRSGDAGASGTGYIENPSMRRRNDGDLIVDGGLKARHMASELVITQGLQVGAAIINTAHIVDLSMTTAKIGAQAVSADWNTYTAGWVSFLGSSGGSLALLTINDSTVNGCPAWFTFSAQVGLRRTTAGLASGTVTFFLGSTQVAEFYVQANVAAGVEVQIPISVTRRVMLPASGPHDISVTATSDEVTVGGGNQFRLRYRRLEVNVFKR